MTPQTDAKTILKQGLVEGTINVVAALGLENTTTNAICEACGVNVAYIYRFFSDKEDLIAKAFSSVDERFLDVILDNFAVLDYEGIDYESCCRVLFMKCWDFILAHPKAFTFYIRYYYSLSFQKYACAEHMKRYAVLFNKIETVFPDMVDVKTVMHYILSAVLGEATKQIGNPKEECNAAAVKTFSLIFSVIKGCAKQDKFCR